MKAILVAALNPLDVPDLGATEKVTFSNALLWPILIVATLFIGYLCFDAWIGHRRKKRMNEWRKRMKR